MRLHLVFIFVCSFVFGQNSVSNSEKKWVDSLYQSLTFEQKLGQLFMVAAYSNKDEKHLKSLENLIQNNSIGGLIFFQGTPYKQAQITNRLQKKSKVPLFVGIDAEWGLSMRLDSVFSYPWNMTLGAIQELSLHQKVGKQLGMQAKRLGVHFTFGPVVDMNTNAQNPIIGSRSYGETKEIVTQRALAFVKGLQSENIFATAKHFPGHGDTSSDSHLKLPKVHFSKERLQNIELYPYKKLIADSLASIMVAHLEVPALEPKRKIPSSLSYATITDLLKKELHFKGLIFTDALNMKGASMSKPKGEVDVEAFLAGNDILLFSENVPLAIEKLKKAYQEKKITDKRLEESVKKILKYKFRAGLNKYQPIELGSLTQDLNKFEYTELNKILFQKAITTVKNENVLPLTFQEKIALITLGDGSNEQFVHLFKNNTNVRIFSLEEIKHTHVLKNFNKILISFHKTDSPWKKQHFTPQEIQIISKLAKIKPTVLVSFARAYSLTKLPTEHLKGLVVAYQNNSWAFQAVFDILYGNLPSQGKLPVRINATFGANSGLITSTNDNKFSDSLLLKTEGFKKKNEANKIVDKKLYASAESQKMNPFKLSEIEAIANEAINFQYTPGLQVLVARNGKIVYHKSFGKQTYDIHSIKVSNQTFYDLASLSKILGTLPMVMKMVQQNKLDLNGTLGQYLFEFKNTDKEFITIKELLLHESGLKSWIPFYKNTLVDGFPDQVLYKNTYSEKYSVQVSENLFLDKNYINQMMQEIIDSPLGEKKYVYSDLNFILLQKIIENHYKKPLDELLEKNFYTPLKTKLMYNPLQVLDADKIAPTEEDNYFRHTIIQGYVHDMAAAMFGGVSGNAGLFGSSIDVFKMMQFFLTGKTSDGKQLVTESILNIFNTCYSCFKQNRRALGFDKQPKKGRGPACSCVSASSFGHTGFTGTFAWADPDKQLVYVFLSNRTFPNAQDNKLARTKIRERIQEVIYQSLVE